MTRTILFTILVSINLILAPRCRHLGNGTTLRISENGGCVIQYRVEWDAIDVLQCVVDNL